MYDVQNTILRSTHLRFDYALNFSITGSIARALRDVRELSQRLGSIEKNVCRCILAYVMDSVISIELNGLMQ